MNEKYRTFINFREKIKYMYNLNDIINYYNRCIDFTQDQTEQQLIKSVLLNKKYHRVIDPEKFMINLDLLERVDNYHEACEVYEELIKNTDDKAQLKTLLRLLKKKPIQNSTINNSNQQKIQVIKNCPHCQKPYIAPSTQDYVVCGYSNSHTGYDWIGCGKDWCFRCGKKLCKSWTIDSLYHPQNRYHDKNCCRKHAEKNGIKYDEYCQCTNSYVRRTDYRVPFLSEFS